MGALMDALQRSSGELIRSTDWNALISAVEGIEVSLNERITNEVATVTGRLDGLDGEVGQLQEQAEEIGTRLTTVETELADAVALVERIRDRFRGVTLQTPRSNFAIGELAQISAQITDLSGQPVTFGSGEARPWVDFVTAWGQLRPVPGFTSAGGAGDRTISVQVNAEGVARVHLRAEHAEGFAEEVEQEVAAALTTSIGTTQQTVVEAILAANTPLEARERGAFTLLTTEYERKDARSMQQYVDGYYLKNPAIVGGKVAGNFFHRWRDYRSTVMAFAKSDGDPRTADPNLGACSIQVTFRDWIGPWIHLDFFDRPQLSNDYAREIERVITPDLGQTNRAIRDRVRDLVSDAGLIGKHRVYDSLVVAMDRVEVTTPPAFMEDLRTTVKNGIRVQQGLEYGQNVGIRAATESVAIDAFAQSAEFSEHMTRGIEQTVNLHVEQAIAQAETQIEQTVSAAQSEFLDDFYASSGTFMTMRNEVQTLRGNVAQFEAQVAQKANYDLVARFLENR